MQSAGNTVELCFKGFFPPIAQQPLVGQGFLIIEASRSHSHTPNSVGLLWTSDQPDAETSTSQHTTFTTDIHAPGGIRTRNPSKRAAADPKQYEQLHYTHTTVPHL
jgi:hypothetical protein